MDVVFARDTENSGPKQLLDVLQSSFDNARYSARSVVAGLVISFGGSIVLLIVFCLIRPRHNLIYAPKVKYIAGKKRPTPLSNGVLSWFFHMFKVKEPELVDKLGLDATLFIRFIKMCRNITFALSIVICGVAIPLNVHYNMQSASSDNLQRINDAFILMTPSLITGTPVVAHIAITYVVDFVVLFFLWTNLSKVIKLRRSTFMTQEYQRQLFIRTLTVTEIPKSNRSEDGLVHMMRSWDKRIKGSHQNEIQQVKIGRDSKQVTQLMEKHTRTVYALESVLAKYLKNPDNLPVRRPKCKPFKDDRQTFSGKVDAIDYYGKRLKALEEKIINARESIDESPTMSFGFVSYYTQPDCHAVAKDLGSAQLKRRGKVLVQLASRPSDIIWPNIILTRMERGSKQFWGNFLFFVLLILWIVPNAFIGCFITDLSRIGELWPAFQRFLNANPILFAILQGFLSPMVTALIFLVLPIIMRRMSQFQGRITKNERERDVIRKLYIFFFFNNFFVVTIIGVAWNVGAQIVSFIDGSEGDLTVSKAWKELRLGQQIAPAIINASSFWVMYLIRANIAGVVDLLQVVSLSWKSFQKHFMSPTPRQIIQWTAPESYLFATNLNWMLFYTTIGLCFTSIQPIIMPILCLYLTCAVIFKKYALMYMFVTKVESDAEYWPLAHKCILFATGFGNLMMICIVWIKGDWKMAVGVAPLFVILLVFWIITSRKIKTKFDYFIPDEEERRVLDVQRGYDKQDWDKESSLLLSERYQNPAINKKFSVPMVHAKAQHALPHVCNFLDEGMHDDDEYVMGYEYNKRGGATEDVFADTAMGNIPVGDHKRQSRLAGGTMFDIVPESELNFDTAPSAFRDEAVPYAAHNFGIDDSSTLHSKEERYLKPYEGENEPGYPSASYSRSIYDNSRDATDYSNSAYEAGDQPRYDGDQLRYDGDHGVPLNPINSSYSGYSSGEADSMHHDNGLYPSTNGLYPETQYPPHTWSSQQLERVPSPLYGGTSPSLGVAQDYGQRASTDEDRQRLL